AARSSWRASWRSAWRSASRPRTERHDMSWFRKPKKKLQADQRREVPADVFAKCPQCGEILYRARLAQNLQVCPSCGYHFRISADEYVALLIDPGEWVELDAELRSVDPLGFADVKPYTARLAAAEAASKHGEAVVTGT